MTAQTPRPWTATGVQSCHGGYQCTVLEEPSFGSHALADVYGATREEAKANARLVAAAPEMLAALRATLDQLSELTKGEGCDHSVGICWCETFRVMDAAAAISKAQGQK